MARRRAAGSCEHQHQHANSRCTRMTGDSDGPEARKHYRTRARVRILNVSRTSERRSPRGRLSQPNMVLPAKYSWGKKER